jgi:hypothetical protein
MNATSTKKQLTNFYRKCPLPPSALRNALKALTWPNSPYYKKSFHDSIRTKTKWLREKKDWGNKYHFAALKAWRTRRKNG